MKNFKKYRKSQEAFQVPEQYFSRNAGRLKAIAGDEQQGGVWVLPGRHKFLAISMMAAAILIIALFNFWPQSSEQPSLNLASLSDEEIADYLISSYVYEENQEFIFEVNDQDLTTTNWQPLDDIPPEILEEAVSENILLEEL